MLKYINIHKNSISVSHYINWDFYVAYIKIQNNKIKLNLYCWLCIFFVFLLKKKTTSKCKFNLLSHNVAFNDQTEGNNAINYLINAKKCLIYSVTVRFIENLQEKSASGCLIITTKG